MNYSNCFLALFCGSKELKAVGYQRAEVKSQFQLTNNGTFVNSEEIRFSTARKRNWGNMTHLGFYDSLTGGSRVNPIGKITNPSSVEIGQVVVFEPGTLKISPLNV